MTATNVPEPQEGQTWQRNDRRDGGVQVLVVAVDDAFVFVTAVRSSRIRRNNFTRQYTFVSGPRS